MTTIALGQTSLPDTDPSTISPGISKQDAPGVSGNWTYNFGTKLRVWGSAHRNFEIMNTDKGSSSTLALRTYDGGASEWTDWREFLFRDANGLMIFAVESFYSKGQNNFDGDLLLKSNNSDGFRNYGAAISFSKVSGGSNKRASIVAKQTGTDNDNIGLAFFTHSNTSTDDLVERMVVTGSGNVGIGTGTPDSGLEIVKKGDGVSVLKLTTQRPWEFIQNGVDGSAYLGLRSTTGSKSFQILSPSNLRTAIFHVNDVPESNKVVLVRDGGKVGIGTGSPDEKLTVKGTIHSEEVKVDLTVPGPDYVFESDYNLRSLEETEEYIQTNKHLPEIPSAKEMEANGVQLGEMNMLLLKKIEELTLYIIEQEKRIQKLEERR